MDEFFVDLLTYTCPFSGRKRCAISAGLETAVAVKKPLLIEEDAWLIRKNILGLFQAIQNNRDFVNGLSHC